MIDIELDTTEINQALNRLLENGQDLTPTFKDIGEELINSTKKRFTDEKAPDGSGWKELDSETKKAKGHSHILHQEGILAKQFSYQASGHELVIANLESYAALHQFGGGGMKVDVPSYTRKGKTVRAYSFINNTDARPFMGISTGDRDEIFAILTEYLDD